MAAAKPMQARTAWVAGKVKLVPAQEKFWYTACFHCNKSLDAEYGRTIFCSACQEQTVIQLRSHLEVYLTDDTGTISATMYSTNAEKLMGNTAVTLQMLQNEGHHIECKVEEAIENKCVVCFIKCHDKFVKGTLLRKYPIVKLYPYEEVFPAVVADGTSKDIIGMLTPSKGKNKQLLQQDEEMEIAEQSGISTHSESQLFSPTTKLLLEEISSSSSQASIEAPRTASVKRSLSFATPAEVGNSDANSTISSATVEAAIQEEKCAKQVESLVKKVKNKEKQS